MTFIPFIPCLNCGCQTAVPGVACPSCDEMVPDALEEMDLLAAELEHQAKLDPMPPVHPRQFAHFVRAVRAALTLDDITSVCMHCKKVIRPAKVFHDPPLESHGICPTCFKLHHS